MGSRVLHVVAAGEIGGAERMLIDLLRGSSSASSASSTSTPASIALFTPNDRLRQLFREASLEIDDRGVAVRQGPLPFLASSLGWSDVRWLADVIDRRNAKIVHLHTFASQVLGTRAALRAKTRPQIVRTEHSSRVYDDPSCWPFSRWSLARADAVVCISDHVRNVAVARAPWAAPRMSVVHNGVDTTWFAPRHSAGGGASHATSDAAVRFIALGRLDARKGLDLAIEAMAKVPRAHLDVVGDGDERASLEDLARQRGVADRVHFRGFTTDVRDAIANADVALSSARQEGLGIALLEAMAMERPVVGVPIGGVVEIVREGDTGWLADVRTAEALARVMQRAIDHPDECVRRGKQARERVMKSFSLEAMRSSYATIYERLSA